MTLADRAERGTRETCDARFLKHAARDRRSISERKSGDVREHIERACWRAAGDAVDLVEPGHDRIAPRAERLHHLRHLGWTLIHGRDPGALRERRGARDR